MATTTKTKILCSTCQKAAGVLTCPGCNNAFCSRHVTEHRQQLNRQMDEIGANHDQLKQLIVEQEAQPTCHPLMEQIDKWEQESITKIHQAADDARKQILTIICTHRTQVTDNLAVLTQELSRARDEDDYVETELNEWIEKLDQLKIDLNAAQALHFDQDDSETSLISKIYIDNSSISTFYQTTGNVQITDDGKIVTHGTVNAYAAARCTRGYSVGQHRVRFKIDYLTPGNGFSCGIVSKSTPIESIFNNTINCNTVGYQQATAAIPTYNIGYNPYLQGFPQPMHQIQPILPGISSVLNHDHVFSFHGQQNCNFRSNAIYELLIDCDQKIIRLTNEQTRQTEVVNVNVAQCPFPWQFFITLLFANDRVSLC
ncbi:unnamed protein product [Adineta steineri]|uniref:Uncharacterized protein n=1 Tax=Adineta steineri TaxID=433720 RepID=A0A814MXV9_9BILA|nr:unnamed protein product [Adineta steineri]CAF3768082.1 unnamed protein product [Adineta steineri]